jgi:hypothetical protein
MCSQYGGGWLESNQAIATVKINRLPREAAMAFR